MENEHLMGNPSAGASLPWAIMAATPFFMGIAALKFKSGDMEAMGKNLGGSVMVLALDLQTGGNIGVL